MAYGIDFRRKVLSVRKKEKLRLTEVSERFSIGVATVVRWHKEVERKKRGFRNRKIDTAALLQDVKSHPDAYQFERAARFGVAKSSIWYSLKKIGITYKKKSKTSESERRGTWSFPSKDKGV